MFLVLAVFLPISFSAGQSIPLSESFNGEFPPPGWVTFVRMEDGQPWLRFASQFDDDPWGSRAASLRSDASPLRSSHHWLITPPLLPGADLLTFDFFAATQSPSQDGGDSLLILASIGRAEPESFTDTLAVLLPGPNGDFDDNFTRVSINLISYYDSTILIAFVHVVRGEGDNNVFIDNIHGPGLSPLPIPPVAPSPSCPAHDVAVATQLAWSNIYNPDVVYVYFSRASEDVEYRFSGSLVAQGIRADSFQPPSHLLSQTNYYWRVVARNTFGEAASPIWQFTTGDGNLAGTYSVGDSVTDFVSLNDVLTALQTHGVGGPTTIRLAAGTYDGPLIIPAIAGASESSPIIFEPADSGQAVTVIASFSSDSGAIVLDGATYVILTDINAVAAGTIKHGIVIRSGSSNNIIRNATIQGPGAGIAGSNGICLRGPGCIGNQFENLQISGFRWGVNLDNLSSTSDNGNRIEHCQVDSVRCGIRLVRQSDCHIIGNDINPNAGSAEEADGVWVGTTLPGDSLFIHENSIHQITTAGSYAVGIRLRPDSANAVVRIYNNFIFDFRASGSAQVRAIYISSGRTEIVSNSILVNDQDATGSAYNIYVGALGAQASTLLKNNILVNLESTSTAYSYFTLSTASPLESDYNIFHGTGSSYRLGRWGLDQMTLPAWQAATGKDAHTLAGDPSFISATDLHISDAGELAHQNGAVISYITEDIDGDSRLIPPDRGADEFVFAAPAADFAALDFVSLRDAYAELTDHTIRVVIQNRGSQIQVGVPVHLLFNDEIQDEATITLESLGIDTLALHWLTHSAPDSGILKVECQLTNDARPANDSISAFVRIIPAPLAGVYHIGGSDPQFPNLASALSALSVRGVSGPTDILIASGTYDEQITIPFIPGASGENRIRIAPEDDFGSVEINNSSAPATIILSGSRQILLEDLVIRATAPNVVGLQLTLGSDSNTVSNCAFYGSSLTAITACGIQTNGGGNDANRIIGSTIQGFYHGIRLTGAGNNPDNFSLIENCEISDSRISIRADNQDSSSIRSNTIHTGYAGATGVCIGIFLGGMGAQMTTIADGNLLTGGQGADSCIGIYINSGNGTAAVQNNMIANWNVTGTRPTFGILIGGGNAQINFNSLWMNDISGSGAVVAIADTSSNSSANVLNNAIKITEQQNSVWSFSLTSGVGFASDFNAFSLPYAVNSNTFLARRSGTNYSSLNDWQTASGFDLTSLSGAPGFIDSLNLHIRPQANLLDGRGLMLSNITTDFDGEERNSPPDIGADEYFYRLVNYDLGVAWQAVPDSVYWSDTTYVIPVRISNEGIADVQDVPIYLFFDGELVDWIAETLPAGAEDFSEFHWHTGPAKVHQGILKAHVSLPPDSFAANDSVTANVFVVGPPMQGSYLISADSSHVNPLALGNLNYAMLNLVLRGVAGPTTFKLESGVYGGPIVFGNISGVSPENPVVFKSYADAGALAEIRCSFGQSVMLLDSVHDLHFYNLKFTAAGSCTTAVLLTNHSSRIDIVGCDIQATDSSNGATVGIQVHSDGCNNNTIDGVTIRGAFTGIALRGGAGTESGFGNIVQHCDIMNARYGVQAGRQADLTIAGNNIQPGSASDVAAACYGIYIAALGEGGGVEIHENVIHGFADGSGSISNRAVGIYAAPTVGATARIYNNFVYDFSGVGSLKISAIYLSSGELYVRHNSVRIDDASNAGETSAIYISTGSGHVIQNNILVSLVQARPSCGILQSGGSGLVSDGNDIYGSSSQFSVGRIGQTAYPTLAQWNAAGFDSNGTSADPNFISFSDLHILESSSTVSNRGIDAGIPFDIDGDERENPPDIGADEYSYQGYADAVRDLTIEFDNNLLQLNWSRANGAVWYRVYRGTQPNNVFLPDNLIAAVADTTFADTLSENSGTIYFYVVTADNSGSP